MLKILVKSMFESRKLLRRIIEVLWRQWKEYIKKKPAWYKFIK